MYFLLVAILVAQATAKDCGISSIKPNLSYNRIVNGFEAIPHSWPWQVSLETSNNWQFCGGTIISPQWVLTAAHCIYDGSSQKPESSVKVKVGNHNLRVKESREVVHDVRWIYRHPLYINHVIGADVALLMLSKPIQFNEHVQPACLPDEKYNLPHFSECFATGWGDTKSTGDQSRLNQAYMPVWDPTRCAKDSYWGSSIAHESKLCAGEPYATKSVCMGDSGGPLNCKINGRFHVMGVASYVPNLSCWADNYPSVFARTSTYVKWINDALSYYGE